MGLLGCRVSALRRVLGRGASKISGPGRGTGLRAWGGFQLRVLDLGQSQAVGFLARLVDTWRLMGRSISRTNTVRTYIKGLITHL